MSVLSKIGKNISNKSKEISQKAKMATDTNSLNNVIKTEEAKIKNQYEEIGKVYYKNHANNPSEEFSDYVKAITESMGKISETQKKIIEIRSQFCCPQCGTAYKKDALFCSKCGTKLPEKNIKINLQEEVKKCAECGNILENNDVFCNSCGAKIKNDEAIKPQNKVCPNCKHEVESENVFCNECGTKL